LCLQRVLINTMHLWVRAVRLKLLPVRHGHLLLGRVAERGRVLHRRGLLRRVRMPELPVLNQLRLWLHLLRRELLHNRLGHLLLRCLEVRWGLLR